MLPNTGARWRMAGTLLLILIVTLFIRLSLLQSQTIVDEAVHVPQIESFMRGSLDTQPNLAMIPGYHLVMAGLMTMAGLSSMGAMRAIGAAFGVIAAVLFYFIRRKLDDDEAVFSALLFFVFPLFFPYYFLAYTDIFSLAIVLSAVLSTLHGRHVLSAVILTLSLAVRQNNVIWAAFLATYASWPMLSRHDLPLSARLGAVSAKAMPYAAPALAFLAYWHWNGSIAFSSKVAGYHPDLGFHAGNVWFALLLFLLLFPYELWKGLKLFGAALRKRPWLIAIPILAGCLVKLRGSGDNHAFTDYFIRNAFIVAVRHGWLKIFTGILVGLAACSMAFTRFREPRGLLVYPFSIVCLASSLLIENRYSIVPFALWMAFRQENSPRWTMFAWLAVSSFLTYGVLTKHFML